MTQLIKYLLILLLCAGGLISCKKKNLVIPSCDYCADAKELNGTYRGAAGGEATPYKPGSWYKGDSVTMTVKQVFLGQFPVEDSTKMYFHTTFKYDSKPDTLHDTVLIYLPSGDARSAYRLYTNYPSTKGEKIPGNYYTFTPQKIRILVMGPDGFSGQVCYMSAIFNRQ